MEDRDDYKFLKLRDAIASINQKVNLIGVILEFGFPKRTRGTDCCFTLKLIDESHKNPGISVNIFAEGLEKLPHVNSAGDIIAFSRVEMKHHAGEVNAVFNKKFSSFALYEGKDGEEFLPYQVSPTFRPRDLDKKLIASLRAWLVDLKLDEGSNNFKLVREIKEGDHVNLLCKIANISKVARDGSMAFVWDGTDARPISIDAKLEDEMDKTLSLQLEASTLPRDVLFNFPPVGTILRLIFDQGIPKHGLSMITTGKWVKFVNVLCEVEAGQWHIVVNAFTKFRYTPNKDSLVLTRERLYNERVSSKWGRIPFWSFPWPSSITEIDCEHIPHATLMDVLTYPEVTAKFKCIVRVVAMSPSRAEDFRSPGGIYRIRLTLEDATARIHALVYDKDGDKFFGGYPSIDELRRKRNKLSGITASDNGKEIEGSSRNPPWVQCCLKSYYLCKTDPWTTRQYRIFGTMVADDGGRQQQMHNRI